MNILTFDIEEWFHLLDNETTQGVVQWQRYPVRIYENMDRIFSVLERHNQKATFFVIGWIAQTYPDVIKRIVANGYDIGFHTTNHELMHQLTPEAFYNDLHVGLDTLENIIGRKVESFRAPGFSLTEECNWTFEILAEKGIKYDSSVFPIPHAHGGYPSFPSVAPALIRTSQGDIKEFPISIATVMGKPMVYSGGGYFRLFPYWMIKKYTQQSLYVMSYLHPRDMDPGQPMIPGLSMARKFKSYVGLKSAEAKLDKWLSDFQFTDMLTASTAIDWGQVPVVDLRK